MDLDPILMYSKTIIIFYFCLIIFVNYYIIDQLPHYMFGFESRPRASYYLFASSIRLSFIWISILLSFDTPLNFLFSRSFSNLAALMAATSPPYSTCEPPNYVPPDEMTMPFLFTRSPFSFLDMHPQAAPILILFYY